MERTLHNEAAEKKLQQLKEQNLILLECIVGSQAYGTAIEGSDIDKKFIYIEPLENVLSDTYTQQLNVDKDYVGYEISRFCELIAKGNPNMLDLLNMPEDCIISKSPLFKEYFEDNMHLFITKKIEGAFGRYAHDQIAKAHGANKKVMDPMDKHRKGLLDFCWVASGQGTIALKSLLLSRTGGAEIPCVFGVQALDHMKNCYNLYLDKKYLDGYIKWEKDHNTRVFPPEASFHAQRSYKGVTDVDDVQIVLSSIKRGAKPIATFYCNIEGFQTYCKKYKEYWAWVEDRNELRYLTNVSVGKGYDCYVDEETEFLTVEGWKKFDNITDKDVLGSINNNKELIFLPIQDRHESIYTGDIYTYESRYTRFSVSSNHNLFLAIYNRSKNGFNQNTELKDLEFKFERADSILKSKYDRIHISNLYNNALCKGVLDLTNDELFLLGAFISDGTICFNKKKEAKRIVIQQKKDSPLALRLESLCSYKYESNPEYPGFVFTDEKFVNWANDNIGHGTFIKKIPLNKFALITKEEFDIFLEGLILGDGNISAKGSREYKSSNKKLIDSVQVLCLKNGYNTQIYTINDKKRDVNTTYSLFISKKKDKYFKISNTLKRPQSGWKINPVENKRIVCFTVATNILITRNKNKIAIQGNTKNMAHCHRLLNMCIEILEKGELNIRRSPNEVKTLLQIRAGEMEYEDLVKNANAKIELIKVLADSSSLPDEVDPELIPRLLFQIRNEAYNLTYSFPSIN